MPLNASGPISLAGATVGQSIALELGRAATTTTSLNETAVRSLLGVPSGPISFSSAYGKSAAPAATDPGGGVLIVSNQTAGLRGVGRSGYHNENVNYTDITNQGPLGPYPDALNITNYNTSISRLYRGYKYIYTTGNYRFRLTSDDGAYMWVGSTATSGYTIANSYINNGGLHAPIAVTGGLLALTAGFFYPIRIVYGNGAGGGQLTLAWEGPGVAFTTSLTNRAFYNSATNGF
jgi:hypothetical protein